MFLKSLGLVLSVFLLYFIPLIVSGGNFEIYYSFTGILFIVLGTGALGVVLFIILKYVSKIPDDVEIDCVRNVLKIRYGDKIVELPFTRVYCVDLNQYLKVCAGGIGLPGLIAGRFKTIDGEYVEVYSESSKAVVVVTHDGRKYVYTAPDGFCK